MPTVLTNDMIEHGLSDMVFGHKADVIRMLQAYNVPVSNSSSDKKIRIEFLRAIKNSDGFRNEVAKYMTKMAGAKSGFYSSSPQKAMPEKSSNSMSFVHQPRDLMDFVHQPRDLAAFVSQPDMSYRSFVNQPQIGFVGQPNMNYRAFVNQPQLSFVKQPGMQYMNLISFDSNGAVEDGSTTPAPVAPATTTTTSKSGFWNTLGGIFDKDTTQTLIKTGLNTYSTSLQNKANAQSEKTALQLSADNLAAKQLEAQIAATKAQEKGMSTGAIVGLSLLGAGVLGTIIFLVVKVSKKKAA